MTGTGTLTRVRRSGVAHRSGTGVLVTIYTLIVVEASATIVAVWIEITLTTLAVAIRAMILLFTISAVLPGVAAAIIASLGGIDRDTSSLVGTDNSRHVWIRALGLRDVTVQATVVDTV